MSRQCWTCMSNHDLDEACPSSYTVRSMRSAGQAGNQLADHTTPDLFDNTDEDAPKFGPILTAQMHGPDACCDEGIVPGEDIRADGRGGWIHADDTCERLARE